MSHIHSRVLVGAPKANDSKTRQLVEPGALYRCPTSSADRRCHPIQVDPRGKNLKRSDDFSFFVWLF